MAESEPHTPVVSNLSPTASDASGGTLTGGTLTNNVAVTGAGTLSNLVVNVGTVTFEDGKKLFAGSSNPSAQATN